MKVYISGKIGSLDINVVRLKFDVAKECVKLANHTPISPLDIDHNHDRTWASYMIEDLKALRECDAILMLPCWKDSPGAKIEHDFAVGSGKAIIYGYDQLLA